MIKTSRHQTPKIIRQEQVELWRDQADKRKVEEKDLKEGLYHQFGQTFSIHGQIMRTDASETSETQKDSQPALNFTKERKSMPPAITEIQTEMEIQPALKSFQVGVPRYEFRSPQHLALATQEYPSYQRLRRNQVRKANFTSLHKYSPNFQMRNTTLGSASAFKIQPAAPANNTIMT